MRVNLRTNIVKHFLTYEKFTQALRGKGLKIDPSVISRIVNTRRSPTDLQRTMFIELLHTPNEELFKENTNDKNDIFFSQ